MEIVNALRPAMASVEGSMLLALYSPYARRDDSWKQHTRQFGKDGDPVLCWQAPALTMNPSLATEIVENAYLEDESATRSRMGVGAPFGSGGSLRLRCAQSLGGVGSDRAVARLGGFLRGLS